MAEVLDQGCTIMLKPIEVSIYVGDSVSVTMLSSPPHPAITVSHCRSPSHELHQTSGKVGT